MYNYINQPCAHCGKHLHEEDDVVVCPVCAAPQHRECWNEEGHCANEALHESGFEWSPKGSESVPGDGSENSGDKKICHVCGSENPVDVFHCGSCGALLDGEAKPGEKITCGFCGTENPADGRVCSQCGAPLAFQSSFFNQNIYMSGVDLPESEKLEEVTVGDAALYVQSSAKRYIPKFKKISDGNKVSFNWAAFIFAPYWFFYRKLYKAGIFFVVLFISISLMTYGTESQLLETSQDFRTQLETLSQEYTGKESDEKAMAEYAEKEEKLLTDYAAKVKKPLAISLGVSIGEKLICGFIANYLYYRKMQKDMEAIRSAEGNDIMKKSLIMRAGGTSLLGLAAGILGNEMLASLLVFIADKITEMSI